MTEYINVRYFPSIGKDGIKYTRIIYDLDDPEFIAMFQYENKLGPYSPTRKNNMNEIVDTVTDQANSIEVKHFALALDKDGKEIRVEINPTTGIAQDVEEEEPTVH